MGKTTGGLRNLTNGSREYLQRQREVGEMIASRKYSSVEFSDEGGGYVAIEKSSARHKPEELEAAKILARKGYKVILKNEGGEVKTPDGYLFSASFEQRTPQSGGVKNFNKCLEHAKVKGADIAVVYDKNRVYNRKDVDDGISRYEKLNNYRFKEILVVSREGRVHRHKHNL